MSSGPSGKHIRDVPCSGCGSLMLRSGRRKGTECGSCRRARIKHPDSNCTGCGAVMKYDSRRKGTRCRSCCDDAARIADRFCTECGVRIGKRATAATTLCRTHAAKSEQRIARLRKSIAVVHADPEFQRRRGRAITAQRLADIPLAYRDEYMSLMRTTGMKARERKRVVLDLAAAAVRQHNKQFERNDHEGQDTE